MAWVAVVLVTGQVLFRKLFDYDLWWHLACGRAMVEGRIFPREELFSHTMRGTPWVNFEWLSQVLLYIGVKAGGLPVVLYGKVLLGLIITGLLALLVRRHGSRGPLSIVWVLMGFLILRPRLFERVELASLVLMPVFVLALSFLRGPPSPLSRKIPWILGGLMVLWANLHGGFLYGIGAVALMAVGARWAGEKTETIQLIDRTVVLCLLAMFVTPFGHHLPEIFIDHAFQMSGGSALIEEWTPTTLAANPVFWIVFIGAAVAMVFGLREKSPAVKFWAATVLVFGVWGSCHQRNAVYLAFFALPFLAELFASHFQNWMERPVVKTTGWIAALLLLGTVATFVPKQPLHDREALQGPLAPNKVPMGVCEFISANGIQGRMYNTYQLGGYIEWALGPGHPVFMDGRYLFHPLLVTHMKLDLHLAQNLEGSPWKNLLTLAGVDHAILDYTPPAFPSQGRTPFPLAWQNLVFPRAEWALVYWDDAGLLLLKRTPAFAPLIKKYEYTALWPYNLEQMSAMVDSKMVSLKMIEQELQRHKQEVSTSAIRQSIQNRFTKGQ